MIAEFFAIKLDQPAAMAGFLVAHAFENGGRRREILLQAFGYVGVNTFVFLFKSDGERENFRLRKAVKIPHDFILFDWISNRAIYI